MRPGLSIEHSSSRVWLLARTEEPAGRRAGAIGVRPGAVDDVLIRAGDIGRRLEEEGTAPVENDRAGTLRLGEGWLRGVGRRQRPQTQTAEGLIDAGKGDRCPGSYAVIR